MGSEDNDDTPWVCQRCTFFNHGSLKACEMCDSPLLSLFTKTKKEVIELFIINDSEEESDVEVGMEKVLKATSIKRSHTKTSAKATERSQLIRSIFKEPYRDPNILPEATIGILELVRIVTDLQQVRCSIASPSCIHYSQSGSYGAAWSCGYRNIQMLGSCLMGVPEFREILFAGNGIVPPIYHIQQFIEQAWRAGFDPEGAAHFKQKLVGSSKYIGTTECAALLRFYRIRAIIVDFPGSSNGANISEEEEDTIMGERLFAWLKKYFSHQWESSSFKSSLYFQHDGHSRSIVGVKWQNNDMKDIESAMVFDPSLNAKSMKDNLLEGNLRWQRQLLRERKAFKKTEYQVLYVAPGLMDDEEWERSKLLVGVSELSEIRSAL